MSKRVREGRSRVQYVCSEANLTDADDGVPPQPRAAPRFKRVTRARHTPCTFLHRSLLRAPTHTHTWLAPPVHTPPPAPPPRSHPTQSSEVEETLKRIQSHRGVQGILIVNSDGVPIKSNLSKEDTETHSALISQVRRRLIFDMSRRPVVVFTARCAGPHAVHEDAEA